MVFMNRAKSRVDRMTGKPILTRESSEFLNKDVAIAVDAQREAGIAITLLRDIFIPERKGIKDAVAGRRRIPPDLENYFAELWDEVVARYFRVTTTARVQNLSEDALRSAYEQLAKDFTTRGNKAVTDFVGTHSSSFLDEFIRANTLAITTKASKKVVEEGLLSHFAEKRIITRQ
jgi:hypothetical protein